MHEKKVISEWAPWSVRDVYGKSWRNHFKRENTKKTHITNKLIMEIKLNPENSLNFKGGSQKGGKITE